MIKAPTELRSPGWLGDRAAFELSLEEQVGRRGTGFHWRWEDTSGYSEGVLECQAKEAEEPRSLLSRGVRWWKLCIRETGPREQRIKWSPGSPAPTDLPVPSPDTHCLSDTTFQQPQTAGHTDCLSPPCLCGGGPSAWKAFPVQGFSLQTQKHGLNSSQGFSLPGNQAR